MILPSLAPRHLKRYKEIGRLLRYFRAHPIFEMEEFVLRPVEAIRTFVWPAVTVLVATVLSGVYPAWRAARIDPAEILRRGA